MKKSEMFKKAQVAVLMGSLCITPEEKLEILHELMERQELEEFVEKKEAEKEESGNV